MLVYVGQCFIPRKQNKGSEDKLNQFLSWKKKLSKEVINDMWINNANFIYNVSDSLTITKSF